MTINNWKPNLLLGNRSWSVRLSKLVYSNSLETRVGRCCAEVHSHFKNGNNRHTFSLFQCLGCRKRSIRVRFFSWRQSHCRFAATADSQKRPTFTHGDALDPRSLTKSTIQHRLFKYVCRRPIPKLAPETTCQSGNFACFDSIQLLINFFNFGSKFLLSGSRDILVKLSLKNTHWCFLE